MNNEVLKKYVEWWALLTVLLVIAVFLIFIGIVLNYNFCNNWFC
jgi:hypothetical protein